MAMLRQPSCTPARSCDPFRPQSQRIAYSNKLPFTLMSHAIMRSQLSAESQMHFGSSQQLLMTVTFCWLWTASCAALSAHQEHFWWRLTWRYSTLLIIARSPHSHLRLLSPGRLA
jgi:hypothetical protein